MKDETIKLLKKLAERKSLFDRMLGEEDCVVDDYAGGNVDDAYEYGETDGEIYLAREILKYEGIDFIKPE